MVQIIAVDGGHGQNPAGIHVHGDGPCAVLDVVILHGLFQVLFHIVLYGGVHRQHQVIAVLAGAVLLKGAEQQLCAVGVGGPQGPSGAAGKGGVVFGLDPFQAGVVHAHKADEMAGKAGIGVIALGVRLQADALQAVFRLEAADLIRLLCLHLPGHGHIPGAGTARLFQYIIVVKPKDF